MLSSHNFNQGIGCHDIHSETEMKIWHCSSKNVVPISFSGRSCTIVLNTVLCNGLFGDLNLLCSSSIIHRQSITPLKKRTAQLPLHKSSLILLVGNHLSRRNYKKWNIRIGLAADAINHNFSVEILMFIITLHT